MKYYINLSYYNNAFNAVAHKTKEEAEYFYIHTPEIEVNGNFPTASFTKEIRVIDVNIPTPTIRLDACYIDSGKYPGKLFLEFIPNDRVKDTVLHNDYLMLTDEADDDVVRYQNFLDMKSYAYIGGGIKDFYRETIEVELPK